MKPFKYIRSVFIYLLILPGLQAISQDLPILTFRQQEQISLRWPAQHDADLGGYHVYRRVDGTGDWQKITSEPLTMMRSVAQIRQQAGYKTELFMQLFGAVNPLRDIDDQAYRNVINDPVSLSFLDIMTLINPEFGHLMGVIYVDEFPETGKQVQYKVTTIKNGVELDHAQSRNVLTGSDDMVPVVTGMEGEGIHQAAILSWDKNRKELKEGTMVTFAVYRSDNLLGEYERMNPYGILPVKITSGDLVSREDREEFKDSYLENGKLYYYHVRAVNAFGIEGPASITVEVIPGDHRIPRSPYDLQAEAFGTGLKLTWKSRTPDIKGVEVFKSMERGKDYARIYPLDDLLLNTADFMIDLDIRTATPYYYYLTTVSNTGRRSDPSDTLAVFLEDKIPPSPPGPVKAIAESGKIILSWPSNREADISGYEVERASDDAFKSRFLLTNDILKDTVFTDSLPARSETTYGYVVYAIDQSYNRSLPSEMVKARMQDITPPTPPVITKLTRKGRSVYIEWTRSTEKDLAAYRIYRSESTPDEMKGLDLSFINSYTDTIEESGKYLYAVSALDSTGNESKASMPLSVTYDRYEVPEMPTEGKAELAGNFIRVEWKAVTQPGTAGFLVTREEVASGKKLDVAQVKADVTLYIDRFARPGSEYVYYIKTYDERWRMSEALAVKYKP